MAFILHLTIGGYFGIGHSAVSKAAMDMERLITGNRRMRKEVEGMISHFPPEADLPLVDEG